MKQELTLPYAEIYTVSNSHSGVKTKEYIKKKLEKIHPGFTADTLWDFASINKKQIKVVVLDKEYFIQTRLNNPFSSFYIRNENKKITLFSFWTFTNTGKRRNFNIIKILLTLLILILICLSIIKHKDATPLPQLTSSSIEASIQIPNVMNSFDFLNFPARIIYENSGTVTNINYIYDQKGKLSITVKGMQPYSLIEKLSSADYIEECICSNIIFSNSIENFEIQILSKPLTLFISQKTNLELLELQKDFINSLFENNIPIINSSINQDLCKVSINIKADRNDVENLHYILSNLLFKGHFFLTDFLEYMNDDNSCFIQIGFIKLDDEQIIENVFTQDYLSRILPVIQNEIQVTKQNTVTKTEKNITTNKNEHNYRKIGSAIKDGKKLFYYRTEEEKIFISEDEL